jgi:hypothetical protein
MEEQKKTLGLRLRKQVAKLKPHVDRYDLTAYVGFGLFIRGIAMFSHPLAYIAAGVALCAVSYLTAPRATEAEQ